MTLDTIFTYWIESVENSVQCPFRSEEWINPFAICQNLSHFCADQKEAPNAETAYFKHCHKTETTVVRFKRSVEESGIVPGCVENGWMGLL